MLQYFIDRLPESALSQDEGRKADLHDLVEELLSPSLKDFAMMKDHFSDYLERLNYARARPTHREELELALYEILGRKFFSKSLETPKYFGVYP